MGADKPVGPWKRPSTVVPGPVYVLEVVPVYKPISILFFVAHKDNTRTLPSRLGLRTTRVCPLPSVEMDSVAPEAEEEWVLSRDLTEKEGLDPQRKEVEGETRRCPRCVTGAGTQRNRQWGWCTRRTHLWGRGDNPRIPSVQQRVREPTVKFRPCKDGSVTDQDEDCRWDDGRTDNHFDPGHSSDPTEHSLYECDGFRSRSEITL